MNHVFVWTVRDVIGLIIVAAWIITVLIVLLVGLIKGK